MGRCTFFLWLNIQYVHDNRKFAAHVIMCFNWNTGNVVLVDGVLCRLHENLRILCFFERSRQKKKSSISATFLFTETDRELSHLDWRLFFLLFLSFTTRNLSKTQMASEVKPQIKDYLLIYQKYQQTGKRKQNPKQIGHSKSMYTYTLRKELSVELGRRGERKTSGS